MYSDETKSLKPADLKEMTLYSRSIVFVFVTFICLLAFSIDFVFIQHLLKAIEKPNSSSRLALHVWHGMEVLLPFQSCVGHLTPVH